MSKILGSVWFTTCMGDLIGIVKCREPYSNEIKYYIGAAPCTNEKHDSEYIVKYGCRLYPEQIKMMLRL